jgi:ribosomal protein S27AE
MAGRACVVCNKPVGEDDGHMRCAHVAHAACLVQTQKVQMSDLKCPRCQTSVFAANAPKYRSLTKYTTRKAFKLTVKVFVTMVVLRVVIFACFLLFRVLVPIRWFFEPFVTLYK